MSWKKLLDAASESLNDHLRLRNDYLMAENRILRNQIDGRVQLTDNVVFLSAMRSTSIRDRPIPYRHRFGGLLGDDYRDVA